jgi:exodeoxyribonuclease V alpha subunit
LFDIAVKTFLKSVESDGIDNVVIAVPRRKDCLNSTTELNKVIQDKLLGDVKQSISGFEMTFKLGAKVMQTVNDYDKNVFNGEIGYNLGTIKTESDENVNINIESYSFETDDTWKEDEEFILYAMQEDINYTIGMLAENENFTISE